MKPIFEDVLRALLIGTDVAGPRVFLMRAPQVPTDQQRTPYLVFFQVGDSPQHAITGPLQLLDREYQVSIFDPSQSRAIGIADQLQAALNGVRGDYSGVRFGGIFYRSRTATYEHLAQLFHVIVTFRILFQLLDSFQSLTLNPRNPNATQRRTPQ